MLLTRHEKAVRDFLACIGFCVLLSNTQLGKTMYKSLMIKIRHFFDLHKGGALKDIANRIKPNEKKE